MSNILHDLAEAGAHRVLVLTLNQAVFSDEEKEPMIARIAEYCARPSDRAPTAVLLDLRQAAVVSDIGSVFVSFVLAIRKHIPVGLGFGVVLPDERRFAAFQQTKTTKLVALGVSRDDLLQTTENWPKIEPHAPRGSPPEIKAPASPCCNSAILTKRFCSCCGQELK